MSGWPSPPYPPQPLSPGGRELDVVIIGAGAAGLMAARMLNDAGHSVTVLEASSRPGGRVHTLRNSFSQGAHVECGAAFLPCNHTYTVGLARDFGLELLELVPTLGRTRGGLLSTEFVGGVRIVEPDKATRWPESLEIPDGTTLAELFERYVMKTLREVMEGPDPRSAEWPPAHLEPLDQISFEDFLRKQGASDGVISLLRLGLPDLWGDGIASTSALFILRDMATGMSPGGAECEAVQHSRHPGIRVPRGAHGGSAQSTTGMPVFQLQGGNDRIPGAMAKALGSVVQYRTEVRMISVQGDSVLIAAQVGAELKEFRADRVVVAVPPPALAGIIFSPGLSEAKKESIAGLGRTSVVRTYLEFETRFWEAEGLEGLAHTDLPEEPSDGFLPRVWINNQTIAQETEAGILETYVVGPLARKLGSLSPEERVEFTLTQMEAVFPGAREHYSGKSRSWVWDEVPGAESGYCYFRPGQLTAFWRELGRAEGPLHFAGDHTSALPGWIQGALESGERVAREIHGTG